MSGVKQKPLPIGVPHSDIVLQFPSQPSSSQKPTSWVADMQVVFAASRQVAPPLYTVQVPPQMFPMRLVQKVTVVACAARLASGLKGSPMKVSSASVVARKCAISASLTMELATPWVFTT